MFKIEVSAEIGTLLSSPVDTSGQIEITHVSLKKANEKGQIFVPFKKQSNTGGFFMKAEGVVNENQTAIFEVWDAQTEEEAFRKLENASHLAYRWAAVRITGETVVVVRPGTVSNDTLKNSAAYFATTKGYNGQTVDLGA